MGDFLNEPDHGIGIAERDGSPAGVGLRENTLLEAFHGKGDDGPCGYDVQPQEVAKLGAAGHGRQVVDAQQTAQPGQSFVLRAAEAFVQGVVRGVR